MRVGFRDNFAPRGNKEAFRAFSVFGLLLLILVAVTIRLAFRESSMTVLTARLDQGQQEAQRIANAVAVVGREGDGINFSLVNDKRRELRNFIDRVLDTRLFIHHVEIRDRFGVRQLFVGRRPTVPQPTSLKLASWLPVDWPAVDQQILSVALPGSGGEVLLVVSQRSLLEELEGVRDSLRLRFTLAALLTLGVLIGCFVYVIYLIRKNEQLEQARQSSDRASYVGLLASGLAHEIRNPLNAMNMNLQMLEEELALDGQSDSEEHRELLDSTKREIKRLERLVNNFLAYARPADPRFKPSDLNALVTEVARFLEGDFRQNDIEINLNLAQLLPTAEFDETLLKQALMNLLVNARQVLQRGGQITLTTRASVSGEVVVEIRDDGPGIPAEVQDRIFEVFFSNRGGGTGLGLPIARQIVERHGGRIELESTVGKGATFRIRLPRRHVSSERVADDPVVLP